MDKYQAHEAVTPINLENCGLHIRTFLSTKSVTFRHWNAETYPLSLLSKFEHSYTRKLSLYIVKHNPDKVHRQGQTMGQEEFAQAKILRSINACIETRGNAL